MEGITNCIPDSEKARLLVLPRETGLIIWCTPPDLNREPTD